jgi:hypothetical protein
VSEKYPNHLDILRNPSFQTQKGNVTLLNYEILNFQQFIDLKNKEEMIVVIPISPIEIHGKYLPMSADYIESYLALELLVEILNQKRPEKNYTLIEYPGIPLGTGTNRGHPGTVHISRKTFYDVCVGIFESLVKAGFRKILAMSVHHGMTHSYAIEQAATKIMKKYKKMDVRIGSPNHMIAKTIYMDDPKTVFAKYAQARGQPPLTEDELKAINCDHHAGLMEIAFVKKISEKLVDPSYKTSPRHIDQMTDQLKALLIEKYATHPPKDPYGCGYNADPSFFESRDWYTLFSDMIKDVGLMYIDALTHCDRSLIKPLEDMNPWKQKIWWLETMRKLFLSANTRQNYTILLVSILIAIPWILFFLK